MRQQIGVMEMIHDGWPWTGFAQLLRGTCRLQAAGQQWCKCGHGPRNMRGNSDSKGSKILQDNPLGPVALLSAMATENPDPDLLLKNLTHDGRPLGFISCIVFKFYPKPQTLALFFLKGNHEQPQPPSYLGI